jgi:exodeoxyribonuclease-3
VKLATWNVNSIRAREERLLRWLAKHQPDVLCLQELKVTDEAFPHLPVRAAGYHSTVLGQKTYNGVAILSRPEPADVERGLGEDDEQARRVAARVGRVNVVSAYVPNGQEVGSEKWRYKLEWLKGLRAWLDRRFARTDLVALCGDFNVAPEARDVYDPAEWEPSVLFHPEARAALEHVRAWGFVDAFRLHNQAPGLYTWWDYRMLAFPRGRGLRIDRDERKGKQPSDHAPVVVELCLSEELRR